MWGRAVVSAAAICIAPAFAQSANRSLFLISRNCREGNLNKCQMMAATDNDDDGDDVSRSSSMDRMSMSGTGNHHFVYV